MGDCVNISLDRDAVAAIAAIPCSEPHDAQVYAFGDVSAGDYPGEAAIDKTVDERCGHRFEAIVGGRADADKLAVTYLTPVLEGWPANRRFACLVTHADGSALVGNVIGQFSREALPATPTQL